MSTKYTPGDWAVVTLDERRYVMVSREDSPFPGVAVATECNATGSAANMNLMAAAPELLESLTELLEFAIEANNRIPSPGTREELAAGFGCNPFMVAQFKKARAAIAKATAE